MDAVAENFSCGIASKVSPKGCNIVAEGNALGNNRQQIFALKGQYKKRKFLFCCDGARALARFNVQKHEARKTASPLGLGALKRRKRRAPLAPNFHRSNLRASINSQTEGDALGYDVVPFGAKTILNAA